MSFFNRMIKMELALEVLRGKDYIFLYADPRSSNEHEKRGSRAKEVIKPIKYFEIMYSNKELSKEKKIEEGFVVDNGIGLHLEYKSLRKNDMSDFINILFSTSKNIVVDFTLMNTRFLGAFCAFLNIVNWNEVYFCYTEPGEYNKDEGDKFDLKNATMGFDQIPGLETISDSSTKCDWVVFLGFEGSRSVRLDDESSYNRRCVVPYICIPSMKPNWHNFALDANSQFFELKLKDQDLIRYVSAINPFETYEELELLKKRNADIRLVISPIGPKPVMLGCVMHVLENEEEMILFDNPYQEGKNTIEFGNSFFYDLTYFVRTVKNNRFYKEENDS